MSLLDINLSSILKSKRSAFITIYARSSALIVLLIGINFVNLVVQLTITSIALYFCLVSSLINSSNLTIKSTVTLLYSCLGAL